MGAFFMGKSQTRSVGNDIDRIVNEAKLKLQGELDRTGDKIDAELNSCSRELKNSINTLNQIKPLIDRLAQQVGANAPEHINVLVGSICQEVMSKVASAIDNQREVQQNICDIDKHTDRLDTLTDDVSDMLSEIDKLTDQFQN